MKHQPTPLTLITSIKMVISPVVSVYTVSVLVHAGGSVARATLTLTPSSRNKVVVGELVSN